MTNFHPEIIRNAKKMLSDGVLSKKDIAKRLGISWETIYKWCHNGFPEASCRLDDLGDGTARCRLCHQILPIERFTFCSVKGRKIPYRLSCCTPCRNKRARERIRSSLESKLKNRVQVLRGYARRSNKEFDLTFDYLLELYRVQGGRCVYTGFDLDWMGKNTNDDGNGRHGGGSRNWMSMSVDRVNPASGYICGNVVLCSLKANTIKQDMSLQHLMTWLPGWYENLIALRQEMQKNCGIVFLQCQDHD